MRDKLKLWEIGVLSTIGIILSVIVVDVITFEESPRAVLDTMSERIFSTWITLLCVKYFGERRAAQDSESK